MQSVKYIIVAVLLQITFAGTVFGDSITDLISTKTEKNEVTSKKVITTKSSVIDDEKIRIRLEKIFSELEELKHIALNVSNGVVELNGSTISIASKIFCKFFLSVFRLYQIIPRNILSI